MAHSHVVKGRILAVQEERLSLETDSGQNLLLTLGRFARLPADLSDLLHSQALVRVTYTGEPNLVSGVVKKIELMSK